MSQYKPEQDSVNRSADFDLGYFAAQGEQDFAVQAFGFVQVN